LQAIHCAMILIECLFIQHDYRSNPFQLIPCQTFEQNAEQEPPYAISVALRALVLMDIHAHMTHTEVIGLLGGRVEHKELQVYVAIPCNSISTDIQVGCLSMMTISFI
jgi:hypothetical protein